jgi:hypothetical protein
LVRDAIQDSVGPTSHLGHAELHWGSGAEFTGFGVEATQDAPTKSGFAVWGRKVRVETALIPAAVAAATGGELKVKLVIHDGGFRFDMASEEAPPEPPKPEPTPSEEGGDPLSMSLDIGLDLQGIDLHIRSGGPLLLGEGLNASGRLLLGRDLGAEFPEPLQITAKVLRLPMGEAETPWSDSLVMHDVALDVKRFAFPAGGGLGELLLEATLSCARLEVSGLRFADIVLAVKVANGIAHLELAGRHPGAKGLVALATDVDSTNDTAWPLSFDVNLAQIPVEGLVADGAPFLLPVVHSTRGRRGGFPPVSAGIKGDLKLVFGDDGFDGQETLDSISASGFASMKGGAFHASAVLRAYVGALTQLEVLDLIGGVIPNQLTFSSVGSKFDIEGDTLQVRALTLESDQLVLSADAKIGLVSQNYDLRLRGQGKGGVPEPVRVVLSTLNRVGGVRLRGNFSRDEVEAVLPSQSALLKAIRAEGAGAVWLNRGGPVLGEAKNALEDALRGLGPR